MSEGAINLVSLAAAGLANLICVVLAVRAFLREREARIVEAARRAKVLEDEDAHAEAVQGLERFSGIAEVMRPKTVEELSLLRRELARAGMRSQDAVGFYSAVRGFSVIAGGGIFLLAIFGTGFGPGGLFLGAAALLVGLMGPQWWLRSKVSERQERLTRSLPPTLDLLVTCMEAGLGLEQAMARVAAEISYSDPEMSEELSVVVGELRAGLSTGAAFKKLADRVSSDDMKNLTNVIIQSSALGASLGRSLREYAASARRRRELGLEEAAGKVTAGLTLPLTLCLLPSAVIAMLGPAVVIVVNSLFE